MIEGARGRRAVLFAGVSASNIWDSGNRTYDAIGPGITAGMQVTRHIQLLPAQLISRLCKGTWITDDSTKIFVIRIFLVCRPTT
jgi:hypothetical protein